MKPGHSMRSPFKSNACTPKRFREIRRMQTEFCQYIGERRRLWFRFEVGEQLPEWPCCYALYVDGRLVYIGQTENLLYRMRSHVAKTLRSIPAASRVEIKARLGLRFGDWAMVEARLIRRLQPSLNRKGVAAKEESYA